MSDAQKTILVVEDESSMRRVLVDKLSLEAFSVLEAKNGEEGLKIALEKHPDLILLDIIMPRMDGITMLKKLRDDEWGKKVEVILLTNLSEKEKIAEAMEQETFEYLVKTDWKIEDVVEKVKEKLAE
jgi:CheY-like chemotaxis protein